MSNFDNNKAVEILFSNSNIIEKYTLNESTNIAISKIKHDNYYSNKLEFNYSKKVEDTLLKWLGYDNE